MRRKTRSKRNRRARSTRWSAKAWPPEGMATKTACMCKAIVCQCSCWSAHDTKACLLPMPNQSTWCPIPEAQECNLDSVFPLPPFPLLPWPAQEPLTIRGYLFLHDLLQRQNTRAKFKVTFKGWKSKGIISTQKGLSVLRIECKPWPCSTTQ